MMVAEMLKVSTYTWVNEAQIAKVLKAGTGHWTAAIQSVRSKTKWHSL